MSLRCMTVNVGLRQKATFSILQQPEQMLAVCKDCLSLKHGGSCAADAVVLCQLASMAWQRLTWSCYSSMSGSGMPCTSLSQEHENNHMFYPARRGELRLRLILSL